MQSRRISETIRPGRPWFSNRLLIDSYMAGRLEELRNTIEHRHDCKAEHVNSVRVVEMAGFRKTWQGVVEVFELTGHPDARNCYAWRCSTSAEPKYIAILDIPPVNSAQAAVRLAIARGDDA